MHFLDDPYSRRALATGMQGAADILGSLSTGRRAQTPVFAQQMADIGMQRRMAEATRGLIGQVPEQYRGLLGAMNAADPRMAMQTAVGMLGPQAAEKRYVVGGNLVGPQGEVYYEGGDDFFNNEKVQMLIASGADPQTALKIASGRLKVVIDAYGNKRLVDLADPGTSEAVAGGGLGEGPADMTEPPTVPADIDYTGALAGQGIAANIANTVADFFGLGMPAPEANRASEALTNLGIRTRAIMQGSVPGRPSNYLLQLFEKIELTPESIQLGKQRFAERATQTRDLVQRAVDENVEVVQRAGEFTPAQVAKARQNIIAFKSLLRDYETILSTLDLDGAPENAAGSGEAGVAPGPVQIQNDDDYDALPSGSVFIGPDGVKRQKP